MLLRFGLLCVCARAVVVVCLWLSRCWKWCDTPWEKRIKMASVFYFCCCCCCFSSHLILLILIIPLIQNKPNFVKMLTFRTWHTTTTVHTQTQTEKKKDDLATTTHSQQKPSSRRNDLFIIWNYSVLVLVLLLLRHDTTIHKKIKHIPFPILMFVFVFVILLLFVFCVLIVWGVENIHFVWDGFQVKCSVGYYCCCWWCFFCCSLWPTEIFSTESISLWVL